MISKPSGKLSPSAGPPWLSAFVLHYGVREVYLNLPHLASGATTTWLRPYRLLQHPDEASAGSALTRWCRVGNLRELWQRVVTSVP